MAARALVAAPDAAHFDWLAEALADRIALEHCASCAYEEVAARLDGAGFQAVFVQADGAAQGDGTALIRALRRRWPELPVIAVGDAADAGTVLAAVRAGAADYLVRHRDDDQLRELVAEALRKVAPAEMPGPGGRLFAVLSGQAYDGLAFFAEHLALACHRLRRPGQRILLVDAAQPAGAAAVYLNLSQPYTLLDAINDADRCDETLIDSAFPRHGSGLYVLSLPEDLVAPPELPQDGLLRLLGVLRPLFSVTVLALDNAFAVRGMGEVLASCDRGLLLSDQSILKSRHNKYLLRALRYEGAELGRCALVVDNYRPRLGLEPEALAELLELPLLGALSGQGVHRIQSMNTGEPLFELAPRDPWCQDMLGLASTLLGDGQDEARVGRRGWLQRLFG